MIKTFYFSSFVRVVFLQILDSLQFYQNFQVLILLLTEITPKSIAVHNATEVARVVVSFDRISCKVRCSYASALMNITNKIIQGKMQLVRF